jgi:hypothetical protein
VTLLQGLAWLAATLAAWRLVGRVWRRTAAALRRLSSASDGEADFKPLRRIVLFVEESVERALRSAGFEPVDDRARRRVRLCCRRHRRGRRSGASRHR